MNSSSFLVLEVFKLVLVQGKSFAWLQQGCNIVIEGQRTVLKVLKHLALILSRAELVFSLKNAVSQ